MARRTEPPLRPRRSNHFHALDVNTAAVLHEIRRAETGVARVELTAATGLAPQTISDVCRRLLEQDLIMEAGKANGGIGKPRTLLQLNPGGRFAIGVHIDPAVITYVVLDLTGAVRKRTHHRTPRVTDPSAVIQQIASTTAHLVDSSGVERSRIIGVGVATPGPIDSKRGVVVDPPHLSGWHDVRLRDDLQAATDLPVTLGKDVVAAAAGERWAGGAGGSRDFAFIYLGTGIGAGLVVNDVVVHGASGNAGDVGHLITDVDGAACPCGQRGCFGTACSRLTLTREAARAGLLTAPPHEGDPVDVARKFEALCQAADRGETRAVEILEGAARRMARAVDDIANLLDVEVVVLGGPAWTPAARHYLPVLQRCVNAEFVVQEIHGVTVLSSVVGRDVGAFGGACLVLDRALFSPSAIMLAAHDRRAEMSSDGDARAATARTAAAAGRSS